MAKWLKDVFEQAEKDYNDLPEWKKKLIILGELKEVSSIREKTKPDSLRYHNDEWT
jgi:hypothetical protein